MAFEILALKVLDHSQLEDPLIVQVEYPRGNLVELSFNAGTQPPFSGDELVAQPHGPDQDRLQHSMLSQGIGKRSDLARVELPSRLKRIGINLIDCDLDQLRRLQRTAFETPFFATQKRFQTATKTSFIHGQ